MCKKKLVLGPLDSYDEFKEKFKKMFGVEWEDWSENAKQYGSEEICGWSDEKISAGCSAYDMRIKVYALS